MHSRELRLQDVPIVLEGMHNKPVLHDLQIDFVSKTIEDCEKFIEDSLLDIYIQHLAIVDESDIYQGTVSLKNIFYRSVEFAITILSSVLDGEIAAEAMNNIIEIGFEEKALSSIYSSVSPGNKKAVRFYDRKRNHRASATGLNIRRKQRITDFENTICISSKERKGGTESPEKEPEYKNEYGFSFPSFSFCCLKR